MDMTKIQNIKKYWEDEKAKLQKAEAVIETLNNQKKSISDELASKNIDINNLAAVIKEKQDQLSEIDRKIADNIDILESLTNMEG